MAYISNSVFRLVIANLMFSFEKSVGYCLDVSLKMAIG